MKTARLFRTIWRINGLLLLLVFLTLGGLALVGALSALLPDRHRRAPPAAVSENGERLQLGSLREVEGTPFVLFPLEAHAPGGKLSSGSGDERRTRNLLVYDAGTGAVRWLLPDHTAVIGDYQLLRESGSVQQDEDARRGAKDPVRWIRYELVAKSASGEEDGPRRVAVSGPGGEGFTVLLGDLDEVLGYAAPREATLLVFFRRGDESFLGDIDLAGRKLRRTVPLPKP